MFPITIHTRQAEEKSRKRRAILALVMLTVLGVLGAGLAAHAAMPVSAGFLPG